MTLRVLHYADLEAAYDVPERVGRLVTAIDELRDDHTVVTGGGDTTGPSVLSMATGGQQALDFFESVQPDVDVFGNHEFDDSPERARELARESPQTWLNANVFDDGVRFAREETSPITTVETAGGTVGFFGLSPPDLADIKPHLDFDVTDPVEAATDATHVLREQHDVDHVVGVSHCGDDTALAEHIDAAAVLGGHDHEIRDEVVAGTRLVRTGAAGRYLVDVRIEDDGSTNTRWHDVTEFEPDENITTALHDRLADLGLGETVTRIDGPVSRDVRDGASPVGHFVAEAFRRAGDDGDAEVGLINSLTMRDCGVPLDGEVTLADLHSLVPFGGQLVMLELTGADLRAVAREAAGWHLDRDIELWNGQFAGLELTWNPAAGRVESLSVHGEQVVVDGDLVAPDQRFSVTTIRYLAVEDVEYPTLTEDQVVAEPGGVHDAMATQAREHGIPTRPPGWLTRRQAGEKPKPTSR
ncbi:bifunctional metallophosphatase/5'-nucleotidase [Haloarchaeobius sp. DYHT-AS-18]|uniref:bifunctional metallophosphatase/5'-nucleotidase n=1 Tax=Haloarchaeobius sp. DYHT-AS-18 TaxID=3446117 RepID=UPI003EBF3A6A